MTGASKTRKGSRVVRINDRTWRKLEAAFGPLRSSADLARALRCLLDAAEAKR